MSITIEEIEKQIGDYVSRQSKTFELAGDLKDFLENLGVLVVGPYQIEEHKRDTNLESFLIEFRAKTNEGIQKKLARFGEPLGEVLDLYGLRLVVPTVTDLDDISQKINYELWLDPSTEEMTIRGGEMYFSPFRDYRKRDWEGASPLSGPGYDEAIHINRKTKYGIVEIQVMTQNLYGRYYSGGEEGHAEFKKRQEEHFQKK